MFQGQVRYNSYGSYSPAVRCWRRCPADGEPVAKRKGRRGLTTLYLLSLASGWGANVLGAGGALWRHGIWLQAEVPTPEPSTDFLAILERSSFVPLAVMAVLLCFSLLSFTVIFAKFS